MYLIISNNKRESIKTKKNEVNNFVEHGHKNGFICNVWQRTYESQHCF